MSRKRILLATSILVGTLLAGFSLIRPQRAVAQQSAIRERQGGAIPKGFGRLVDKNAYLTTGGAALVFEAGDGTIRIVSISVEGQPEEAFVFRRN